MEGLFPLNNMKSTTHQLIHLVESIASIGPIRCWWEFYGERLNHTIKETLPPGGLSSERVSIRKLIDIEVSKMSSFYDTALCTSPDRTAPNSEVFWSWAPNTQSMIFKPDKIHLCQAEKDKVYHCDAWELEQLYLLATKRQQGRELTGRLHELRLKYRRWKRTNNNKTMVEWMRSADCEIEDKESMSRLMTISSPYRTIFKEGVRFLCRGIDARESGIPSPTPIKPCNSIQDVWHHKSWYSSLCELATREDGAVEVVANLNAVWVVDFPEDESIHGLIVASVTSRNISSRDMPTLLNPILAVNQEWPSRNSIITTSGDGSYNNKYRIVDVELDITPHNLAIIAFDQASDKPIRPVTVTVQKQSTDEQRKRGKMTVDFHTGVQISRIDTLKIPQG